MSVGGPKLTRLRWSVIMDSVGPCYLEKLYTQMHVVWFSFFFMLPDTYLTIWKNTSAKIVSCFRFKRDVAPVFMLAGRDVFLEKNKSPNQSVVLSFFHLLIRTKKSEPNIRVTSNVRKEQHGPFILACNLKDFFFHLQSFPAGLTTVTQHFSSNPIVISPKENLSIFIPVTSSSVSCHLLSACVTKPNSITVSVEATNPPLGFLRLWKKARTSHWREYTYIVDWIQFCVPLIVFGLKLSSEVCIAAMTL